MTLLAVAVLLGVAGASLMAYCILRLVRLARRAVVSRLPVGPAPRVTLDEAGAFVLNIETPRLSLAGLGMGPLTMKGTVYDTQTGQERPMRPALVAASVKGFSRMRRPLLRFQIERPGTYELRIDGIPDRKGLADCRFVVSRPLGIIVVALVLGIILGAGVTIAAVVLPIAIGHGPDPLAASRVDACLDGADASCEGLLETAQSRCDSGDGDGCHVAGLLHAQGRGAVQDRTRAAQLFRTACEGRVAQGCVNFGWALQHGEGVAVDLDLAAAAFEQACAANLGLGCHNLGALQYERGRTDDAIDAFDRGCARGYANACHNLAAMLIERNAEGDADRARVLYRQACDAGLAMSCRALEP